MSKVFGAYLHSKPDGSPFYVGKGTRKRMRDFYTTRSNWHKNIVAKYEKKNIHTNFIECSSESIAFDLERGLIKTLRANGYVLCNLSNGGEGPAGYKFDPALVERIRQKNLGRVQSAEERAMRSEKMKGIPKSVPMSDEHKRKLGLNAKGKKWYNNRTNIAFCLEGQQPDGYVLGRLSTKLVKE
jgi:hypothetical protein